MTIRLQINHIKGDWPAFPEVKDMIPILKELSCLVDSPLFSVNAMILRNWQRAL